MAEIGSPRHSRREFFANVAVLVSLIPGLGVLAHHVFRFLIPPAGQRTEEILLAKLDALPPGSSRAFHGVMGNDLIAVHLPSGQVKVFSSICTHLGCHIQWDALAGNFLCPCHLGRFDSSGRVLEGPPPAPLPSFQTRVDKDNIWVVVPVKEA